MAIEQWGFFCVSHLLSHGASIYNGHLRGPGTLTPIVERLAVELSLPVFATLGFEHPTFHLQGERFSPLCHRRGPINCIYKIDCIHIYKIRMDYCSFEYIVVNRFLQLVKLFTDITNIANIFCQEHLLFISLCTSGSNHSARVLTQNKPLHVRYITCTCISKLVVPSGYTHQLQKKWQY